MSLPTQTSTSWATAIPTLVAQRALPILKKTATFYRSVYTNGDIASLGTPFSIGSTIDIRVPNSYTARTKSADTAITFDNKTATKVSVVLDKYIYSAIAPEDFARMLVNIPNGNIIDEELGPMVYALRSAIEDYIAAEYANVSAQIGTPGALLTPDLVRQAAQTLDDANVLDDGNRYLKLRPKDIYALLGHPDFIPYFAATQVQAIREGIVGRMYGFEIDKSQHVYASGGTTYGMAFHRSAFAAVTRPFPQPMSSGANQATVTDPDTGLAITTVMAWDQSYQADTLVAKIAAGFKTVRDSCAVVVLT